MGPVAVHAFYALLHMQPVLTHGCLGPVALGSAARRGGSFLFVRPVAVMAGETGHGAFLGITGVALEAFVLGEHGQGGSRKGMALDAGEFPHLDSVDSLILVTLLAREIIGRKIVHLTDMAGLALDLLR